MQTLRSPFRPAASELPLWGPVTVSSSRRWLWGCQPGTSQHLGKARGSWPFFCIYGFISDLSFQQALHLNNEISRYLWHCSSVQEMWGIGPEAEAAKTSFSRNMLDVIPKGQWELHESRPRSLHCALTPRLMLKKGDSWNCPIWASEEVLPRLWSSFFLSWLTRSCSFLIYS